MLGTLVEDLVNHECHMALQMHGNNKTGTIVGKPV